MADIIVNAALGALGGALWALKGYYENKKADDKEKFDVAFFFKTLLMPIVVGGITGFYTADPIAAFSGGMVGKGLQEVMSLHGVK